MGILDRRLGHEHRLETPRSSAPSRHACVLIERGGADAMQLAPRQRRFNRFDASMAPSALPAPIKVCISSMNRMMPPSADVTPAARP